MPSGDLRKPLGITVGLEEGLENDFEDEEVLPAEANDETCGGDVAAAGLQGKWEANRDAEALAAVRELMPIFIPRVVEAVLRRHADWEERASEKLDVTCEDATFLEVSLSRKSKKSLPRWGFRWNEAKFERDLLV